ncbi:uncharacterized protein ATNIH1004_008660 [Aspergillus tanneri]|uniref:Uncharacterized protein n=1 Tax=Aspergillus tanneri TaxID=1220188 RepID=A0A5M9MFC6_9EURO|nr:uncharacterized protein ATNIH1004_008660 [Aspergillus tanneri]KAA8644456.1 hypothetical protein ATNIH1004_008660 [Aspergillus tanneri]
MLYKAERIPQDESDDACEPQYSMDEEGKPWTTETTTQRIKPGFRQLGILLFLLIASLISNILLYTHNRRLKLAVDHKGFTGIYARGETWKQFHTYTEYSNVNQTISNAAWETFTTNGFVAIPHQEAADFGLPLAEDFPDDPTKGVYVLEGFHEIHCVVGTSPFVLERF